MKGAVIDLGTNTFSLLVFEEKTSVWNVITTDKSFVNLGEAGINKNIIAPKAMTRAYHTIEKFVGICIENGVDSSRICAFGTSALRNAENAEEFMQIISKNLQLDIVLIDGEKEAQLVYEAVKNVHKFNEGTSCIMDIGGGSTEFTLTDNQVFVDSKSFKIGLSRLIQMKELSDPLSAEDSVQIKAFLAEEVGDYFKPYTIRDLVGTGGSFETYFHLINETFELDYSKSYHLPMAQLLETLDYLIHSSLEERMQNPWIVDFRKSMINVAALKTKWSLLQMKAKQCYFSPASLKEGVMITEFS